MKTRTTVSDTHIIGVSHGRIYMKEIYIGWEPNGTELEGTA